MFYDENSDLFSIAILGVTGSISIALSWPNTCYLYLLLLGLGADVWSASQLSLEDGLT